MRSINTVALVLLVWSADAAYAKDPSRPIPAVAGAAAYETSVAADAGKMPEVFYLYGGPGPGEGDFETPLGIPSFDGWISKDLTEGEEYWHLSTFNAANLNDHGPENVAYWCGQSPEQQPGWATAPGYGNSWDQRLEWMSDPVSDPSVGRTVDLEFVFNHETENGYDFLRVEYYKGGTWLEVFAIDGSNQQDMPPWDFLPPGVRYPDDVAPLPIVFDGNDYGGPDQDRILLRLRVTSDGAWSDEGGGFPTSAGACQIDDMVVSYDDGSKIPVVSFSDFDNTNDWTPNVGPFVGDFAQVFAGFQDIDACRNNTSGLMLFVDDGSCPRNVHNNDGQPPCESTGGSPPVYTPSYGVPGGWIVNHTGGLTDDQMSLVNRVISPPIAWDLPGPEDDDPTIAGMTLRFDVWRHLDLNDGIFYTWRIRTSDDGGIAWGDWENDRFVWYGKNPGWITHEVDITTIVDRPFTHVQIALEVNDLAQAFVLPGVGAQPSPAFDNVELLKYRLDGPIITTRHVDLFHGGFPQSGQSTFQTPADRANADVRLDIARDLGGSMTIVPGDSVVVEVVTGVPGTAVGEVKMVWVMDVNPKFDDVRTLPPNATVTAEGALNGWDQWSGETIGRHPTDSWGPIDELFFFDLPDEDFFHPGDVLRYYVEASDDQGRAVTLPADIDGFSNGRTSNGGWYAPPYTVQALPTAVDDGQGGLDQPLILWVEGFGHRGAGNEHVSAFQQQPWIRGIHYDLYTVKAPTGMQDNGIGSAGAHGATPEQLSGYKIIVHAAGDLAVPLFLGKSNDLGVLQAWFEQDDERALAHFGDNVASYLASTPTGSAYLQEVLGVASFGDDVRPILMESNPRVRPLFPEYDIEYAAYGGCLYLNETPDPDHWPLLDLTARKFDDIGPLPGAEVGHQFLDVLDQPYPGPGGAGSVLWDRVDGNDNSKIAATFPYGFNYIWDEPNPNATPVVSRSHLLRELFIDVFRHPIPNPYTPSAIGDEPAFRGLRALRGVPNPFNPRVTISFEIGQRSRVEAEVFNVRGERVMTLLNEERPAGRVTLGWDGRDDRGVEIASGVYFVRVRGDGQSRVQKVALVR